MLNPVVFMGFVAFCSEFHDFSVYLSFTSALYFDCDRIQRLQAGVSFL